MTSNGRLDLFAKVFAAFAENPKQLKVIPSITDEAPGPGAVFIGDLPVKLRGVNNLIADMVTPLIKATPKSREEAISLRATLKQASALSAFMRAATNDELPETLRYEKQVIHDGKVYGVDPLSKQGFEPKTVGLIAQLENAYAAPRDPAGVTPDDIPEGSDVLGKMPRNYASIQAKSLSLSNDALEMVVRAEHMLEASKAMDRLVSEALKEAFPKAGGRKRVFAKDGNVYAAPRKQIPGLPPEIAEMLGDLEDFGDAEVHVMVVGPDELAGPSNGQTGSGRRRGSLGEALGKIFRRRDTDQAFEAETPKPPKQWV